MGGDEPVLPFLPHCSWGLWDSWVTLEGTLGAGPF